MGKLANRNLLIFISLLAFIICFKGMSFSQILAQENGHKLTPDNMENLQQIGEITVGDISQLAFDETGDYLVIGSKSGGIATYHVPTQTLLNSRVEGIQALTPANHDNYVMVAYQGDVDVVPINIKVALEGYLREPPFVPLASAIHMVRNNSMVAFSNYFGDMFPTPMKFPFKHLSHGMPMKKVLSISLICQTVTPSLHWAQIILCASGHWMVNSPVKFI